MLAYIILLNILWSCHSHKKIKASFWEVFNVHGIFSYCHWLLLCWLSFPQIQNKQNKFSYCTEKLRALKNNVYMNIVKRFMPKTSFRLSALADLTVLDVLHLWSYSTKKHIKCFPKCLSWWLFWLLRQKKFRYLHPRIWNNSALLYKDPVGRIKWFHIDVLVLYKHFLKFYYYKDMNSRAQCSLKIQQKYLFLQRVLSEYVVISEGF